MQTLMAKAGHKFMLGLIKLRKDNVKKKIFWTPDLLFYVEWSEFFYFTVLLIRLRDHLVAMLDMSWNMHGFEL
jgi:hypothetical protein